MSKIKLVDGTIVGCTEIVQENGLLQITTSGIAESIRTIFKDKKSNLARIEILTDSEKVTGTMEGYVDYCGISENGAGWKVTLAREVDLTAKRISEAESIAASAQSAAVQSQKTSSENKNGITQTNADLEYVAQAAGIEIPGKEA